MPVEAAGTSALVDIDVSIASDWGEPASWQDVVEQALRAAAAAEDAVLHAGTSVSVRLTDDREIRALNTRFRDRDSATNVLAFPAHDFPGAPPFLGDIIIARETVTREAEEQGLTIHAHVTHLLVHGFLHLLGFDHDAEASARSMESRETAILARLGIQDPYGDSAP